VFPLRRGSVSGGVLNVRVRRETPVQRDQILLGWRESSHGPGIPADPARYRIALSWSAFSPQRAPFERSGSQRPTAAQKPVRPSRPLGLSAYFSGCGRRFKRPASPIADVLIRRRERRGGSKMPEPARVFSYWRPSMLLSPTVAGGPKAQNAPSCTVSYPKLLFDKIRDEPT